MAESSPRRPWRFRRRGGSEMLCAGARQSSVSRRKELVHGGPTRSIVRAAGRQPAGPHVYVGRQGRQSEDGALMATTDKPAIPRVTGRIEKRYDGSLRFQLKVVRYPPVRTTG